MSEIQRQMTAVEADLVAELLEVKARLRQTEAECERLRDRVQHFTRIHADCCHGCERLRAALAERERVARRIVSLITHCGLTIENAPEWLTKQT